MKRPLWITNALLVTQDSRRRVFRGSLRIEKGRITDVRKGDPKKREASAQIVDAKEAAVLPGFVQAHLHLCQTLFRNQADDMELLDWLSKRIWKMEAAHTEETLHTSALLGIHELLSSGTTCILDMGTVRHTESILQAVKETGIRASVGKCLMDHPGTTPPNLRESTRDALSEAQALYKRWNGAENDRIRVSYAPRFVISCTEQLLEEVRRKAHEQKALIHTHASENLKEIQMVKRLVSCENVEYLHQLRLTSEHLVLAHCVWLKNTEKRILQRTGTHVVHCPSSNMKLASGFAHVPELREMGVNVALGADGAPCNNTLNMFQEMRLAALLHKPAHGPKAMRAQDVLDMATRDGAKAVGWWDDIGSIEEGKKADLIGLNLRALENSIDHLDLSGDKIPIAPIASAIVYSSSPQHVLWTYVDGKKVYENGQVKGIRASTLLQRVRESRLLIQKRIQKNG